jgi:hypothetical protein
LAKLVGEYWATNSTYQAAVEAEGRATTKRARARCERVSGLCMDRAVHLVWQIMHAPATNAGTMRLKYEILQNELYRRSPESIEEAFQIPLDLTQVATSGIEPELMLEGIIRDIYALTAQAQSREP